MSREAARAFVEKMKQDAAFRKKVLRAENNDERQRLIEDQGFDCSMDEIRELQGEIEGKDLEDIAGGWEHNKDRKSFFEIFGYPLE